MFTQARAVCIKSTVSLTLANAYSLSTGCLLEPIQSVLLATEVVAFCPDPEPVDCLLGGIASEYIVSIEQDVPLPPQRTP